MKRSYDSLKMSYNGPRSDAEKNKREIIRHCMVTSLGEFDPGEMTLIYLFLLFLTAAEDGIDMTSGLSFEEMTELAYRARWMEKEAHMEGDEVFRFICSIRDREFRSTREAVKRGFDDNVNPFFIRKGKQLTSEEIAETVNSCLSSTRVTRFNEWQVAMAENLLSITDGDRILIETEDMPGAFMNIGDGHVSDIIIAVSDSVQRVLTKMVFFMLIPKAEQGRYTITARPENNEEYRGLGYNKSLVLFPGVSLSLRDGAVLEEDIGKGVTMLFVVSDRFLSIRNGRSYENRKVIMELGSDVSVLSFSNKSRIAPSFILMTPKGAGSSVSMLSVRYRDEILNDESCHQIASALKGCEENGFSPSVKKVSREEVSSHDFMLIPEYYRQPVSSEYRSLYEIDTELDIEYVKMRRICSFLAGRSY